MIDLQVLLDEVIDTYGKNKDYPRPDIRWSCENMISRFGEFQYWCNCIAVSNLMDNHTLSKESIKSVIYHEYNHQLFSDHTSEFHKQMDKFPDYELYLDELEHYFNNITELPESIKLSKITFTTENTILCIMPSKTENDYLNVFLYVNHYHFLDWGNNLNVDKKFCETIPNNVIWLVKNTTDYFVVGWSRNVEFYKSSITVKNSKHGEFDYKYQAKVKQSNNRMILQINASCFVPAYLLPESLLQNRICLASDVTDFKVEDIYNYINSYDCDYIEMNTNDDNINAIAPTSETNISKLLKMSQKESNDRGIWIANKAVELTPNYETYFNRAEAFRCCCIYDLALKDYMKALEYRPGDTKLLMQIKKMRAVLKNC